MTGPLSQFFIGGWGSTDAVWRGTLTQASTAEPHFLGWLDCVQDWPGVLTALSARAGTMSSGWMVARQCARAPGGFGFARESCSHGVGFRHAVHVCRQGPWWHRSSHAGSHASPDGEKSRPCAR